MTFLQVSLGCVLRFSDEKGGECRDPQSAVRWKETRCCPRFCDAAKCRKSHERLCVETGICAGPAPPVPMHSCRLPPLPTVLSSQADQKDSGRGGGQVVGSSSSSSVDDKEMWVMMWVTSMLSEKRWGWVGGNGSLS